ncbi:hypothetical protein JMJ35_009457 [Cladonia borealis]|uniref:Uncharacterized protein n=1 Tax=Cladonia borealis TaxID=184061 RepID=A0AA39QV99_9LECA|nr:hypothetical protein JMJ35_009457 [Cladonia borealis]
MPITWDAEANHKMLLYLVKRIENKDIDIDNLATLFEGATPKAIRERVGKLRRESKAIEDGAGAENPILPSPTSDNNNAITDKDNNNDLAGTSIDNNTSPAKARGRPKKNAKNGKDDVVNGGPVANGKGGKTGGGPKRKRGGKVVEEEGYGGDADVEEDAEGRVKKVKTEGGEGDGKDEGEEKGEGAFMVEEEEVEGEGEGMVEA